MNSKCRLLLPIVNNGKSQPPIKANDEVRLEMSSYEVCHPSS